MSHKELQERAVRRTVDLLEEFHQLLEREAVAIQNLEFSFLEELHARKGALRLQIEEATETLAEHGLRLRGGHHPGEEGSVQPLRRALEQTLERQRKNQALAEEVKEQIATELLAFAEKRAAAQGYHVGAQVFAKHVDILR